ncbi:MAG: acyl-CoA dehydrogenase family protein [Deltaproteobacteria bacterium]|nr:acyl-CoA dehydrogenase family protein [Deltaproteobacteria bacterium]
MSALPDDRDSEGKREAMEVAEAARESDWENPSFVGELFMGRFHPDWAFPFPDQVPADREIGDRYIAQLEKFLRENLDPDEVDRSGEMPAPVIQGLAKLGAFAMKIPEKYGGLGLSQINYNRAVMSVAAYCANTAVWLSAHQSIGVPQPLKLFGTEEQKQKFLPRFRDGSISAFALTEPSVGSDPAQMKTTATPIENGDFYLINGEKLWCTNGPVADILVVMAKTSAKEITAFIVETKTPGFEVIHRCEFMGLKAIQNGLLRFKDVKVPKENILLGVGRGLKLALVTLNTGRLTLPAASTGGAKQCLNIVRDWANERVQWGAPIGKHEAVASKLAWMSAYTFAMESMTLYASALVDQGGRDIRLEAAMAKLFCSEVGWKILDHTMQIRGGRGYETAGSLQARGEKPFPVERMMRDARINTIIEGSTEIMHLFIAREALDPHMKLGKKVFDPKAGLGEKFRGLIKMGGFYAWWYPRQWITVGSWLKHGEMGPLAKHYRFIDRTAHRLARSIFHGMARYQLRLERHQVLLAHFVEIGVSLFVMSVACSRALALAGAKSEYANAVELADLFCRYERKEIRRRFKSLFDSDDMRAYRLAGRVLKGDFAWLEEGIMTATELLRQEKPETESSARRQIGSR